MLVGSQHAERDMFFHPEVMTDLPRCCSIILFIWTLVECLISRPTFSASQWKMSTTMLPSRSNSLESCIIYMRTACATSRKSCNFPVYVAMYFWSARVGLTVGRQDQPMSSGAEDSSVYHQWVTFRSVARMCMCACKYVCAMAHLQRINVSKDSRVDKFLLQWLHMTSLAHYRHEAQSRANWIRHTFTWMVTLTDNCIKHSNGYLGCTQVQTFNTHTHTPYVSIQIPKLVHTTCILNEHNFCTAESWTGIITDQSLNRSWFK